MHYYPHNIKSFNNATRHLTRVERSLYRDLIELYYDEEQPLQSVNFDRLARKVLASTEEEKEALRYVLDEFFVLTGDVWTHEKCDAEIEKYRDAVSAKARAGKASAEARKKKAEATKTLRSSKNKQNSTGVEQVLNKCATNQEPITNNQEPLISNQEPLTNNPLTRNQEPITIPDKPKKPSRFTPPTLQEISDYCRERKSSVDPERFLNYYTANGWVQGKGKPIQNWEACVNVWESNSNEKLNAHPNQAENKPRPDLLEIARNQ